MLSLNHWESGPRQVEVSRRLSSCYLILHWMLAATQLLLKAAQATPWEQQGTNSSFFLFPIVGKWPNSNCQNQSLLKSIAVSLSESQWAAQQRQTAAVARALLQVLLEWEPLKIETVPWQKSAQWAYPGFIMAKLLSYQWGDLIPPLCQRDKNKLLCNS